MNTDEYGMNLEMFWKIVVY